MILYNTPFLMVLAFLGLTLVVSFGVNQKVTTFRQYAVGNKDLATATLVATVLASFFGGGTLLREIPNIYESGISHIVLLLTLSMVFWIVSILGLRMGPFMQHLSIAETIGSVYGKYPRMIAAILGIGFTIGVVAIQINVMSYAIRMCIASIDPRIVTVPATLILIAYAMIDGVRAVTITDILQFATFTFVVPIIIHCVFVKTNKSLLEVILLVKNQEKFQFSNLFQLDSKLLRLCLDGLWAMFSLSLSAIQRVYMASSPIQAYKVFVRAALFSVIILGSITLIALLIFAKDPMLPVTEIWPYILADMSPMYKGCVVISLLGMAMSTADSSLHIAAIMASHDIVESIRDVKTSPYVNRLHLAKLTTLAAGLLAMIVTVYYADLFQLTDFVFTSVMTFFKVAVVPPFILAIFGFRGSACTALTGMAIGILVALALEKWSYWNVCAQGANVLAMMAAHYLLPKSDNKGWVGQNDHYKRTRQLIRAFKKYKKSTTKSINLE